jgi:hypothetical protein
MTDTRRASALNARRKANLSVRAKSPQFGENHRENLTLDSGETLRVDKILRDLGFKSEAPESTARALVLNLIRNAYGENAACSALSQWNQSHNTSALIPQFDKKPRSSATPDVLEVQLSFFDEAGELRKSS